MTDSMLLKRIKELRKIHNYSQDYVADVLGITRQTYSHYETGSRKPSIEVIYQLATLYEVSVDDLLNISEINEDKDSEDLLFASQTGNDLTAFLDFFNNPRNKKKYHYHTNYEKELLYYFQKLTDPDKKELIEIAKIKARKPRS